MNRMTLLRYERGLTRDEVAKTVHVSAKQVGQWERGESIPRPATAKALADFYGVSVAELLGADEPNGDDQSLSLAS